MRVGVVGLGYVGLPLAVAFAESGHQVLGVDIDRAKLDRIGDAEPRLQLSDHHRELADADAVIVAVPTPLDEDREPDLGPLDAAIAALSEVIVADQLIALESTTYPGCTRERVAPALERSGLQAGRDFHLAFSPERLSVARPEYPISRVPKLVSGLTPACRERAVALYGEVCETVVPVSALEVAETAKLLENVFRFANISLVNELAEFCDRSGIDVWEVIDAAETKPFGFMRFDPGAGAGGHCLPVDPLYLRQEARRAGASTEMIDAAIRVNDRMPSVCVERIRAALDAKSLDRQRILLVGVSYKSGIADLREAPALELIRLLRQEGARVEYHDPLVPELDRLELRSTPLETGLGACDAAVIVTAHPGLDVASIVDRAPVVIDIPGAARGIEANNLVRL